VAGEDDFLAAEFADQVVDSLIRERKFLGGHVGGTREGRSRLRQGYGEPGDEGRKDEMSRRESAVAHSTALRAGPFK
jgi:hypothetical protein